MPPSPRDLPGRLLLQRPVRSALGIALLVSLSATATAQVALHLDPPVIPGGSLQGVSVLDHDGDGVVDRVFISLSGEEVPRTYAVTPHGTLVDVALAPPELLGVIRAVRDFDDDGFPDLLLRDPDDGFGSVLFGDGLGGFPVSVPLGAQIGFSTVPDVVVDVDGDGILDILWFDGSVVFGLGSRMFAPQTSGSLSEMQGIGDFDLDGDIDFVARGLGKLLRVFLGDGAGNFTLGPVQTNFIGDIQAVRDLDGDGRPDLLVRFGDGYHEYLTQPNLSFVSSPASPITGPDFRLESFGEFNGDGAYDLFGRLESTDAARLLVSAPGGGFAPLQSVADIFPDIEVSDFGVRWSVADLNADGLDELGRTVNGVLRFARNTTGQTAPDCDDDGIPDVDEIASGDALDCDGDGVPDECAIDTGTVADCNANGIPDPCDFADGTLIDGNGDGIADSCTDDCDGDGISDAAAIAAFLVDDCDLDGIPDACAITSGLVPDCNLDGRPDACDVGGATSLDTNANGIPDECDGSAAILRVPQDFPAIATAVGAAQPGDVIEIGPGDYSGPITISNKSLVIRSTDGPAVTTVHGNPAAPSIITIVGDVSNVVTIEGLTIRDGRTTGSQDDGAGILSTGVTLTLVGNRFIANHALDSSSEGGAVRHSGGSARLVRNTFERNESVGRGAGVALRDTSVSLIENRFVRNIARTLGGGVFISNSTVVEITRNEFLDNAGGGNIGAGGLVVENGAGGPVTENVFLRNSGNVGGGASFTKAPGTLVLRNVFRWNASGSSGGGLSIVSGEVVECTIAHNVSSIGGGGYGSAATYSRNHIHHNTATGFSGNLFGGGGLLLSGFTVASSRNNWIHDNRSLTRGGGIGTSGTVICDHDTLVGNVAPVGAAIHGGGSDPITTRCTARGMIIWDGPAGIPAIESSTPQGVRIESSIVEGGFPGIGNNADDPLFVDLAARDLHLTALSPAIDTGSDYPGSALDLDIDGEPRRGCSRLDRGADEWAPAPPCGSAIGTFVCVAGPGSTVELSWSTAQVPDQLELRRDGVTIATLAPTDTSFVDTPNPPSFHLYELVATVGGVPCCPLGCEVALPRTVFVDAAGVPPGDGTAAAPYVSLLDAIHARTTVDGCLLSVAPGTYFGPFSTRGKDLRIESSNGPASTILTNGPVLDTSAVFEFTDAEPDTVRLEGFTITGGTRGGINIEDGAAPRIVGNIIENNSFDPHPTLASAGGGIWIDNDAGPTRISDCWIRNNTAGRRGGGISNSATGVTIEHCRIEGNFTEGLSTDGGGGIYTRASTTMTNLLIVGNTCDNSVGGGGLHVDSGTSATCLHCTITGNFADNGSGITNQSTLTLVNSIVRDNGPAPQEIRALAPLDVSFSIVPPGLTGDVVLNVDPQFVDPVAGDYRPSPTSPAVNLGLILPDLPPTDLDGNPRVECGAPDFGAYELPPPAGGCPSGVAYRRGDCLHDGQIDISDPITVLLILFGGGAAPTCEAACDGNNDGMLDIADAIQIIQYAFEGGSLGVPPQFCAPPGVGGGLPCPVYDDCP